MKRIIAAILFLIGLAPTALWAAVVCPANVTGISPSATSCWPLQETSGTTITDTIDSNSGTIGGGYTLNQNGGIACNNTTTGTNGENGCNITTPSDLSNPQPMTLYFDFAGSSGGIAQLGTSSGTAGVPYYVIFLDNHGKLTFGVDNFDTQEIIQSPLPYADGNEHKAVVSVGAGGEKLYVDGSLVASRNVTLANYVNGYWFFGGINTANWQLSPSYENFNGTLYTFAWWNGSQLTDAQAISLTGGNPSAITNSYCTFTNQIASLNPQKGFALANQKLTFTLNPSQLQLPGGGSNLPIAPNWSEVCQTDASGNILSGCQIPQGAHVNLSVGSGPPISLVIPFSTACDLTAIMLSQTDPPEVVSAVATAGPLFAGATVTNPPAGTIGTATITAPSAFSQTQASAATVNIGTNGNVQQVIMSGNVAVSLTSFASGANFVIDTTENGTGGYSPTFSVPAGWTLSWPGGGSQPAMPSTVANAHVVWQFYAVSSSVLVGNVSSVSTGTFPLTATANFNNYSGININMLDLGTYTAPTPTVAGTCSGTCATTYTYEITCLGDNSTHSAVSAQETATNAASLSSSNHNSLSWTAGTGCTSGYAVYGRVSGSLGLLATTTSTSYNDDGTASPGAAPPSSGTMGIVNGNLNGNLSALTTLGDMPYENSTPALARLAGNTSSTKNFLTQTGTGTVSAAPTWGTVATGDLPATIAPTTVEWNNNTDKSEQNAPRVEVLDFDSPGLWGANESPTDAFGVIKPTVAITVQRADIYLEINAASCGTIPVYNLDYGATLGTSDGTIATSCSTPSGILLFSHAVCTTTPVSIPAGDYVWWSLTTAGASCTAKFGLVYEYTIN